MSIPFNPINHIRHKELWSVGRKDSEKPDELAKAMKEHSDFHDQFRSAPAVTLIPVMPEIASVEHQRLDPQRSSCVLCRDIIERHRLGGHIEQLHGVYVQSKRHQSDI